MCQIFSFSDWPDGVALGDTLVPRHTHTYAHTHTHTHTHKGTIPAEWAGRRGGGMLRILQLPPRPEHRWGISITPPPYITSMTTCPTRSSPIRTMTTRLQLSERKQSDRKNVDATMQAATSRCFVRLRWLRSPIAGCRGLHTHHANKHKLRAHTPRWEDVKSIMSAEQLELVHAHTLSQTNTKSRKRTHAHTYKHQTHRCHCHWLIARYGTPS